MNVLYVFLWIWIILSFPVLIIVVRGPSVWDRVLGLNIIAAKVMFMIVIHATAEQLSFMLDFALIFALTSFIGTIFIIVFVAERQKKLNEASKKPIWQKAARAKTKKKGAR